MPRAINTFRPFALPRVGTQRRQREDAALAGVVRAHHDGDVLDRDDDHERVDDERQHAEHVFRRRRHRMGAEKAFPDRVEGARTDVAVHHADGGQRERKQRASGASGGCGGAVIGAGSADVCHGRVYWEAPAKIRCPGEQTQANSAVAALFPPGPLIRPIITPVAAITI